MRSLHISLFVILGVCALLALVPRLAAAQNTASAAPKEAKAAAATAADALPLDGLPLDGASAYRTRAQQMLADLIAGGETDIDELVAVIATDNRESLDHIVINLATQRIYECNLEGQILAEQQGQHRAARPGDAAGRIPRS